MEPYLYRRPNRKKGHDYSQNGVYFLTICIDGKKCILSRIVPSGSETIPPSLQLSDIGNTVENELIRLGQTYPSLRVDHYVVMPNHVHLLLSLDDPDQDAAGRVTIANAVNQFKGAVTKKLGFRIWQKGYHDHIIRDERDYERRWRYIDDNPRRWEEDSEYRPADN